MKIEADGFKFDFQGALDVFIFDEQDKGKPNFHGLSHAMKAVDLIVEFQEYYLFIEMKDFHSAADYQQGDAFNNLIKSLKYKYRDSWLYRWAEKKTDKPIDYICLLTFENALISRTFKEMRKQLPTKKPIPRWQREFIRNMLVVNLERWNDKFPSWPVNRITTGDV